MARWFEPTQQEEADWQEFLAELPDDLRAVARRFEPWELFRLKDTGDRCTFIELTRNRDTGEIRVTMSITGQFNHTLFDRAVFGLDPDSIEPCEVPAPSEPLGAKLTPEAVMDNIDALRASIRPDLWELGADGVARRRKKH